MTYTICVYSDEFLYKYGAEAGVVIAVGNGSNNSMPLADRMGWNINLEIDNGKLLYSNEDIKGQALLGNSVLLVSNPRICAMAFENKQFVQAPISLKKCDSFTIGRGRGNDAALPTKEVSGEHAVIYKTNEGYVIEDRNSTNFTYVNGEKISYKVLNNGDEIYISGWILIFENESLIFSNTLERPIFSKNVVFVKEPSLTPSLKEKRRLKKAYPYFSRSPRIKSLELKEEIEVQGPGFKQQKPEISWLPVLLPPIATAIATAVMAIFMGPYALIMLPMTLISTIVSLVNYKSQTKKFIKQEKEREIKYDKYLEKLENDLLKKYKEHEQILKNINPNLEECKALVENVERRIFERTVDDDDYLNVRIGLGKRNSGLTFRLPRETENEDELVKKALKLTESLSEYKKTPCTVDIRNVITTGIIGNRTDVVNTVSNIIANISVHHAYDEVKIVMLYDEKESESWEWARWLPHIWSDDKEKRYIATNKSEANALLKEFDEILRQRENQQNENDRNNKFAAMPYYIFVIADRELIENQLILNRLIYATKEMNISSVFAYENLSELPNNCDTIVECKDNMCTQYRRVDYSNKIECSADLADKDILETIARGLAPIRLKKLAEASSLPDCVTFLQGYGVKKVDQLNVLNRWQQSKPYNDIAAPIGIKSNGEQFLFDLHEKELGPHGLVAGTTGFGKSELLQTWLLSVALNFKPDEVSFVLIDFKGEGFAGLMKQLPHVAGTISNIDIAAIKRNLTAINQELNRRQIAFKDAGINNIYKYQKAFYEGKVPEQMSHLIIVIDEFAQMKKDYPEYMDTFISIARVGRSLGVHLVLATQSPSGIVDGQVLSNTRFKMCLKTANISESRDMLGKPDAANITTKGRAIIQAGNDEVYEQIQTFWSGAIYNPDQEFVKSSAKISLLDIQGHRIKPEIYDKTVAVYKGGNEEIEVVVNYIVEQSKKSKCKPAMKIWQDVLETKIYLSDILHNYNSFDGTKYIVKNKGYTPIIGLIDAPDEQSQHPLLLNVGEEGHTAIFGAPRSGKTTLLQTLIISTALMYSPEDVSIYVMDFGAWSMKLFETLPHVGGVANGNDYERLEKLIRLLDKELTYRKNIFAQVGVGNIELYREVSGKSMPYMILLIDNFEAVLSTYQEFDEFFIKLSREGAGVGIIMVLTSGTTGINFKVSNNIKQSLALQLVEKTEYISIVGKTDGLLPATNPGRGLVKGEYVPHEFQTALGIKSVTEGERIELQKAFCNDINDAWKGSRPLPIPVMPQLITQDELECGKDGVDIGLKANEITPLSINFDDNWCMMISGSNKSGKTNMLKLIMNAYLLDDNAKIALYEAKEEEQQFDDVKKKITHITETENFDLFIENLITELKERKETHAKKKRDFNRIAIFIDDYESCFENADEITITRLRQIIKLGQDLNVKLYISGNNSELKKLEHTEGLTMEMALLKGNILLGENADRHPDFKSKLTMAEKNEILEMHMGYFISDQTIKFKVALAGKGEVNAE